MDLKKSKFYGLYTNNSTTVTPEGSMSVARNVVLNKYNIIEPRRGFSFSNSPTADFSKVNGWTGFPTRVFTTSSGTFQYKDATTGIAFPNGYGGVDPQTGLTVYPTAATYTVGSTTFTGVPRAVFYNSHLYLGGIREAAYDLEPNSSTTAQQRMRRAGVPRGTDIVVRQSGSSGFFTGSGQSVTYRYVLYYKDYSNQVFYGAPSNAYTFTASGACNTLVTCYLPTTITTDYYIQIYRSTVAASGVTPSDELQLTNELQITKDHITAGIITFTDTSTDSSLGAYIYTAPSQQGIAKSKYAPPQCFDIQVFKNYMFFSNLKKLNTIDLTLLGCGAPTVTDAMGTSLTQAIRSSVSWQGLTIMGLENGQVWSYDGTTMANTGMSCMGAVQPIYCMIVYRGDLYMINSNSVMVRYTYTTAGTYSLVNNTSLVVSGATTPRAIWTATLNTTGTEAVFVACDNGANTTTAYTTDLANFAGSWTNYHTTILGTCNSIAYFPIDTGDGPKAMYAMGTSTGTVGRVYTFNGQSTSVTLNTTGSSLANCNFTSVAASNQYQNSTGDAAWRLVVAFSSSSATSELWQGNVNLTTGVVTSWTNHTAKLTGHTETQLKLGVSQKSILCLTQTKLYRFQFGLTASTTNAAPAWSYTTTYGLYPHGTKMILNGYNGANYKGWMWDGDTLEVGDTIAVNGQTFTAATSESASTFLIDTTSSTAVRILNTSLSLLRTINRASTPTTIPVGTYLSGASSVPGKLGFELMAGMTWIASKSSCWSRNMTPQISTVLNNAGGVNYGTFQKTQGYIVAQPTGINEMAYSEQFEPQAVPLSNYLKVGSPLFPILRIAALKDTLFILKQDGIFTLRGETSSAFTVQLLDDTTQIVSADSVAVLDNKLYFLSNKGIAQVSDTGVSIISQPIQNLFDDAKLIGQDLSTARGWAYEQESSYYITLWAESSTLRKQMVYNINSQSWVEHRVLPSAEFGYTTKNTTTGIETLSLVCNNGFIDSGVYTERKSFNDSNDYYDNSHQGIGVPPQFSAPAVNQLQMASGWTGSISASLPPEVGMLFSYFDFPDMTRAVVTGVSGSSPNWLLTLQWADGAQRMVDTTKKVTIERTYQVTVEFTPETCSEIAAKNFQKIDYNFKRGIKSAPLYLSFKNELSQNSTSQLVPNDTSDTNPITRSSYVPANKARCVRLQHGFNASIKGNKFQLEQLDIQYDVTSNKKEQR